MNSMISCSKLLAAALCAAVLAGCNAVEDVKEDPIAANPSVNVVLGGHIKDLGSRRALVLQVNGKDACLVPVNVADPNSLKVISECRFLGVPNQEFSAFSFSAINAEALPRLRVGESYSITIKRQPFGKICTVQNPTGTVRVGGDEINVTCTDDPAVTHYSVTVNTAAVASKSGLKVMLTTEFGTCPVTVNSRSSITFSSAECPNLGDVYHQNATYIFNNGLNLPNFQWQVTASIPGATIVDPRKNCFVSGGPVTNTGGNTADNPNSLTELGAVDAANRPAGNVTVTVQSCGFVVRAQADYSRNTGVTTDPAIASGDGVTVALRSQPWGTDVAVAKITSFANTFVPFMVPDSSGNPTTTQYDAQSDANAFYELVVKSSPAGMACVPGYSTTTGTQSTRSVGTISDAGAVLLRRPSSAAVANLWLVDRVVRCRLTAASTTARLRGAYWQYAKTTTTTTIGAGAPTVTAPTVMNRNLLAFFEDGTYLFGSHSGTVGTEQGFYAYNPNSAATAAPESQAANSIIFIPTTDTNGASGINNAGAARSITAVVKSSGTPKTISARVSNTTVTGYVLAAGGLTVTVNGGIATDVAAATYATANLSTLVAAINTASNPGAVAGFPVVATAVGGEIVITGPPGGVALGGTGVSTLGLQAAVAAGTTATSTKVASSLATVVNTIVDWTLTEVGADPLAPATSNPIDGAWITWDFQRQPAPVEDRRRMFVYQHGLYTSFHVGVNGIANMQEACYVDEIGSSGSWVKQSSRSTAGAGAAASAGCSMRQYSIAAGETLQQVLQTRSDCASPLAPWTSTCTVLSATTGDFPSTIGNVILPDYPGRWPQSQTQDATDGRPVSVVDYELRPANSVPSDPVCPAVDKLTVWDTQSGVRKDTLSPAIPRIVLCRITAN